MSVPIEREKRKWSAWETERSEKKRPSTETAAPTAPTAGSEPLERLSLEALEALEGAFKALCAMDVARVRPGAGATYLHAGRAQRCLLAAMLAAVHEALPAAATDEALMPAFTPAEMQRTSLANLINAVNNLKSVTGVSASLISAADPTSGIVFNSGKYCRAWRNESGPT